MVAWPRGARWGAITVRIGSLFDGKARVVPGKVLIRTLDLKAESVSRCLSHHSKTRKNETKLAFVFIACFSCFKLLQKVCFSHF
jgi:hypothetical protein